MESGQKIRQKGKEKRKELDGVEKRKEKKSEERVC